MINLHDDPVLITGGAGYIGSHAMLALLDSGCQTAVVDDLPTQWRSAVPNNVPYYPGKAVDGALIGRVVAGYGCRAVTHFAGCIVVPGSVELPLDYYQNNVVSSAELLRACLDNGIERFVFSTTAAVCDGEGSANVALSEDAVQAPANSYGRSKLMTELMLRDIAAATDLRVAVLCYYVTQALDVVDLVAKDMLGTEPVRRRPGARRASDPASSIADTSRIREALNWQPKYDDLVVMAATALAWEKRLMNGIDG
jgi:UDP-glucose 4-epimerase